MLRDRQSQNLKLPEIFYSLNFLTVPAFVGCAVLSKYPLSIAQRSACSFSIHLVTYFWRFTKIGFISCIHNAFELPSMVTVKSMYFFELVYFIQGVINGHPAFAFLESLKSCLNLFCSIHFSLPSPPSF